jgi:predicted O-methyltransferase YrrM
MEQVHRTGQAVPELVRRARSLAAAAGFTESCTDETGRLLRILARRSRRAGEIGTGYGVGACWILSGLPPGGSLVTIELDPDRARAVHGLLRVEPAVRVRHGDWHELLGEPPFDLLFADGGDAKTHGDQVLRAVAPGGLVVLDDVTPGDPVRQFWLAHPGLVATELMTAPDHAVILAARLP